MGIITLITDFGWQDEYVGLMKGVMLGIDPAARFIDLTHAIDPQDVAQAAFTVESSWRYFPEGTIHAVIVDPGVGTERAMLCLEFQRQVFLAPDNGVLSLLLDAEPRGTLRRLDNSDYWRCAVSRTFHGRDVMAPVAAHLSRGAETSALGPAIDPARAVRIDDLKACLQASGEVCGRIIHIDRFGNLITNIDAGALRSRGSSWDIAFGTGRIRGVSGTYADAQSGAGLALIGSRGYLEIAVNSGSARDLFSARKGDAVRVRPLPDKTGTRP
ncbi:MAG TPA: SAM-dependent chlorinase/fluorinase [Desulfobacterales bacterium]|nr:SAM-dependent chlorinase/fluorinase [Desulfobacterales bacterium]